MTLLPTHLAVQRRTRRLSSGWSVTRVGDRITVVRSDGGNFYGGPDWAVSLAEQLEDACG